MPSLSSENWKIRNSPYINRFLQPDTIIPDPFNPQSWNRFSYVHNVPTGYADPTGHMRVADEDLSKNTASMDCRKHSRYCNGGKKKSDKELQTMHPMNQKQEPVCGHFWVKNFANGGGGRIPSWDCGQIDPVEWDDLLKNVGDDVYLFSTGWYDTPFFNKYGLLAGTGCFDNDCYDRSQLNYIGEGEALAALGFSKEGAKAVVSLWKNTIWRKPPSDEVMKFTEVGWNYYNEHYSSPSLSVISLFQLSGMGKYKYLVQP